MEIQREVGSVFHMKSTDIPKPSKLHISKEKIIHENPHTLSKHFAVTCGFKALIGSSRFLASARPAFAPCAASGAKRMVAPSLPPVLVSLS